MRLRYASCHQLFDLLCHQRNIQRNAVSEYIGARRMAYSARKRVQREFPVLIDNGMTCIRASLIADNNVRMVGKRIHDLAFSFVSPVGSYYRLYHFFTPSLSRLLYEDLRRDSEFFRV